MGLLKIISSLFHGTEKSSELFEAEIPVAQENTSHDLIFALGLLSKRKISKT